MTVERAKEHLSEYGRDRDVLEFDVSSATVELDGEGDRMCA